MAAQTTETESRLTPSELETAARMILGHDRIRVLPGSWWSYIPRDNLITYPAQLLGEWSTGRLIGAICHEIAEARYTGASGSSIVGRWLRAQSQKGLPAGTAMLLVNTINDMRVNRLYLQNYPGARGFFRELYSEVTELHPKDDRADNPPARDGRLAHHLFVDALTDRWAREEWGQQDPADDVPEVVRRATDKAWSSVQKAAESDDIEKMLDVIRKKVVPAYRKLVELTPLPSDAAAADDLEILDRAETAGEQLDGGESEDLPEDSESISGIEGDIERARAGARSADEAESDDKAGRRLQRFTARDRAGGRRGPPSAAELGGDRWTTSLVQQMREEEDQQIDYTRFDYRLAVSILEDQIRETIDGDGRRPGLAAIMDRRRHGMNDALRRPRKQRTGDQGEIDVEHPERLLTDPVAAFLKGVRIPREDRQRDFASAILLDISGSMVQKGYPTRKFDRLVETAVLFIEIHERLRIPFEVFGFSSNVTPLWSFADCRWPRGILSDRSYEPRDHSESFCRLYELDHKDTDDAGALRTAIERCQAQDGLKSIFVVTDGISSDPSELRRVLMDLDRGNRSRSENQRMKVLAFGVGVVKSEFQLAYQPAQFGKVLNSCTGLVVDDMTNVPRLVRDAVDERIRMI
jgi:hypothetical protein